MAMTSSEPVREGALPEPPMAAPRRMSKRAARPYLILAGVVLLGILGYLAFGLLLRGKESTDDAQVEADVVPMSARVSGVVRKVHVTDHQIVTKGQLLFEIDPQDLQAKVSQSEAEVAAAKAQAAAADAQVSIVEATSRGGLSAARAALSGSNASVGGADAQIASARANVVRAEAEASRADVDLKRAEALRKDDAIPQAQVDTARANAAAAAAALAQARAQTQVVQEMKLTAQTRVTESAARVAQSTPVDAQLATARANADLAHARIAGSEATLALARLQLSYARIEAPADGVLSKVAVHEGQLVQPGQQVVAVVPTATYVVANFKETQVGAMKPGQHVEIEVDAFPGRTLHGTIASTAPGTGSRFSLLPPDNASGNFVKVVQRVPVRILWSDLPPELHPSAGMSADVTVLTR
jgi:membrane fusion protein (multidrug efflux system)